MNLAKLKSKILALLGSTALLGACGHGLRNSSSTSAVANNSPRNVATVTVYPFESPNDLFPTSVPVGPAGLYADHFDDTFPNPQWAGKDRLCVAYEGVLTAGGIPAGSGISVGFADLEVAGEIINGERAGTSSTVFGCIDITKLPTGTVSMYFQRGSDYDSNFGQNYQFVLQR